MEHLERTREILKEIYGLGDLEKILYRDEVAQISSLTQKRPLKCDIEVGKALPLNKKLFILKSISVPPLIQGLRIEEVRLRFLLNGLKSQKKIPEEFEDTPRKLAYVLTLIRRWIEMEVNEIPTLKIRTSMGIRFEYIFGEDWKLYVAVKR